ncbi:MAG: hypothetical protein PW788_13335 [Micavibrio sp.]|nr:hypothetical protein [Micavibrio sp.]
MLPLDHLTANAKDIRDIAHNLGRSSETLFGALWQVVTGPENSGRTSLGHDYAAALFDLGITPQKEPVRLDCNRQPLPSDIEDVFNEAKGKMLLLEDPAAAKMERHILLAQLAETLETGSTIVLITGTPAEMKDFIADLPTTTRNSLALTPVEITRSFTVEESAAFNAERNARLRREFELKQQQEDILDWKTRPEVNVAVNRGVKLLKPLRFGTKPQTLK